VVELKEFTEAEAHQFIAAQNRKVNFTDAELEFIFSHLERHPLKLQILCDWVIKSRQRKLSDWALAEEITKEFGNFFVGPFAQLRRLRRVMSLDNIKKLLETIKTGRDTVSGSKK
jgi:hypothetical protein